MVFSKALIQNNDLLDFANSFNIEFINSSQEYTPTKYSLLLLDKDTEGFYSNITFRSENNFDVIAFYDPCRNNIHDILDVKNVLIGLINSPAILNYQQIKALTRLDILIYDSQESNIEAASYDLLLYEDHFISGIKYESNKPFIDIEPLDFVIVRAREFANIPKNICANFDILVSMFVKGLILSNGPQVDPGYKGRFLCLIFNASSKKFSMQTNHKFSTVVFNSLRESTKKPYSGKYQKKPEIRDYVIPYADQSLSSNIERIKGIKDSIDQIELDIKNHNQLIDALKDDTIKNQNEIDRNKRWKTITTSLVLAFLGFIIAFLVAIDYFNVYTNLGKVQKTIDVLTEDNQNLKEKIEEINGSLKSTINKPAEQSTIQLNHSITFKKQ